MPIELVENKQNLNESEENKKKEEANVATNACKYTRSSEFVCLFFLHGSSTACVLWIANTGMKKFIRL